MRSDNGGCEGSRVVTVGTTVVMDDSTSLRCVLLLLNSLLC